MQDSAITFRFKAEGIKEIQAEADSLGVTLTSLTRNANGTFSASGKLSGALDNQTGATNRAEQATSRASKAQENYFVHIAKTTVQSALVNKAFLGLTAAAGDAVKQVDLFNNFPASMQALGLSGKDASDSLIKLRDYAGQTGISLTEATQSVARFSEITKNVKAATAEFIGVKNALIAGGAGADVQSNALEQLIQSYSRGKPQLIEWRSLMVAMPAQLNQVAKAMGQPNAQALGEQLTAGKVNMQDFITELTKLSTGTGPIAQQAIARMQGIEFAGNVLKNALTNGLAAIYQAVGRQNIIQFFTFLTEVIRVLASWAVILINTLITLFNFISGVFGGPQIKNFGAGAADAAASLGDGATNANDMADGLGNAADNAAKINKSLASFDKMNVLPDKTSGKDTGGAGGTGGLNPADAAALGNIFDGIGGKLQEASKWAKIFAGILTGLVALKPLASLLSSLDDVVKGFKNGATGADTFSKKLGGLAKVLKDSLKGDTGVVDATKSGESIGYGLLSGITSAIGASAGKIWKFLFAPLIAAAAYALEFIGTLFLLTFLGAAEVVALPVEAVIAVGALIVAAIAAVGYLIYKNWDTIWKAMKTVVDVTWQGIQKVWDGVVNFFVDIWHGIYNAFVSVVGGIKDFFVGIINFVKSHAALFEIIFAPLIIAVAAVIIVVTGIYDIFKWVFDQIVNVFTGAPGFFANVFQAAVDVVTTIWSVVVAFFQLIWDGIVAIFTAVAGFFSTVFSAAWEAIKAVWNLVSGWFNDIVIQPLITLFTPVVQFLGGIFSKAWDGIKLVWSVVAGFFSGVWSQITGVFAGVASFFGGIFTSAYNAVTGVFSSLWTWFRNNVWNPIVSLFTTIGTTIGDAVTSAFKGVINTVLKGLGNIWNGFIDILNGAINTINKVPGVNLPKVSRWNIPQLAQGGIVDQATMAVIGENGKEAIMPLENNTEWIDTLASKLNKGTNGGQPLQLVVQIGEDKIATKIIDLINEKTQMSGRNMIIV